MMAAPTPDFDVAIHDEHDGRSSSEKLKIGTLATPVETSGEAVRDDNNDLWTAILRNSLPPNDAESEPQSLPEVGYSDRLAEDASIRPAESSISDSDDSDRIKDYLIDEYSKEIATYQTLLEEKERTFAERERLLRSEVEDLTAKVETLNDENELLVQKLLELQILLQKQSDGKKTVKMMDTASETNLPQSSAKESEIEDSPGGLDRDFEHRLVLSAWRHWQQTVLAQMIHSTQPTPQ